jgi:hypothetical protein
MQFVGNVFTFLFKRKKVRVLAIWQLGTGASGQLDFRTATLCALERELFASKLAKIVFLFFCAADVNHVPGFFHPVLFL